MASKKSRTHCRRPECRRKEIRNQLNDLKNFIELFCKNRIEATIEIRLPGNDKLGPEAKIDSFSILGKNFNEKNNQHIGGIKLDELIAYFERLLWKKIKGNFIILVLSDGTVDSKLPSQTFTSITDPIIIGNNLIVSGELKQIEKEGKNYDDD